MYVMAHDSSSLGRDGPTYQLVEHLTSFCEMPNILMLRPVDGNETAGAYKVTVQQVGAATSIEGVENGSYIVSDKSSGKEEKPLKLSPLNV